MEYFVIEGLVKNYHQHHNQNAVAYLTHLFVAHEKLGLLSFVVVYVLDVLYALNNEALLLYV